ncbi:MAG: hypothetical protein FWC40_07965 [Proteobacteria bacterium]|nr:hypothetical protein [Pseudomonadota bacterium]
MSCSSASSEPAAWGDDMTRGYLYERDRDIKAAMTVVKATLSRRQEAYERYRIGNLAFFEIITLPHPDVMDVGARYQHVAVILGKKPRLVSLPDKALFAHFAKNIRPNPDILEFQDRIRTAMLLATGADRIVEKLPPTWVDENGILVIHYHKLFYGGGRESPTREECTLTVDANQDFTLECAKPVELEREFYR